MAAAFEILVVCTGNICRSPQAERLLAMEFARRGLSDVKVSSAGVAALVGNPMDERAAVQTVGYGGDPSGHAARQLDQVMIEHADLVLTMERAHRAAVVRMVPRASRYAFTLPEFARLLEELERANDAVVNGAASAADRFRELVPQVAAGRGMAPPVDAQADEVVDPYRQSNDVYRRSAWQVASAVTSLVRRLASLAGLDTDV